jgi:hypothetical protein
MWQHYFKYVITSKVYTRIRNQCFQELLAPTLKRLRSKVGETQVDLKSKEKKGYVRIEFSSKDEQIQASLKYHKI